MCGIAGFTRLNRAAGRGAASGLTRALLHRGPDQQGVFEGNVATLCAVPGNHDRWIGVGRVRIAFADSGGHWLEDAPWFLTPQCAIYGSREQSLQSASSHLLCTHHPVPSAPPFALTLSGHLHGGQFVLYHRRGKLYPGAFVYRWNGLRFDDRDGRTLLISRGVQDTLPLRWNCPREVLLVKV